MPACFNPAKVDRDSESTSGLPPLSANFEFPATSHHRQSGPYAAIHAGEISRRPAAGCPVRGTERQREREGEREREGQSNVI